MRAVLEARVDSRLFAAQQMERLIVASGGNLRDLFSLTSVACDTAILRNAQRVEASDVDGAIRELRTAYQRRLGGSPAESLLDSKGTERIDYAKKAELLIRIYRGDEDAQVPNPTLYSLLRSRAVLEFNGKRWFGVHPLVVDVLGEQGRITREPDGAFKGGSI